MLVSAVQGSESVKCIHISPPSWVSCTTQCLILPPRLIITEHQAKLLFSSVQLSRSVMSNSLPPHGLQHARLTCPSPTPGACSNSCPSSWGYHPTISSSVDPFSSHPQSFPGSGSFPMSQFFASGGQSIGVSASASVLPMNIQDWFPLGLTSLTSLSKTHKSLLQHHSSKALFL